MSTFTLSSILDKMKQADKDFRYMAISDLSNELLKDSFKMDIDNEKKIVKKLLEMVAQDKAAEVRSFAVKCLSPLVKKVHEEQAQEMFDTLAKYVFESTDEQVRDIAGSGLKTMFEEFPEEQINVIKGIIKRLTPRFLQAIGQKDVETDVLQISLDLVNDLLSKYGKELAADSEKIQKSVLAHITSKHSAVKKKAISCLGYLSNVSAEKQFVELMDLLLNQIKGGKSEAVRTNIQCIGALSRAVGYRMGKQIDRVVPTVLEYVDNDKFKEDDELREICFQTFESLIFRCPKEITPHLDKIISNSLKFLKYDPNYAVSDEDAMDVDDGSGDESGGDDDDDDDGGYSDDDDVSWKVRKAASRCLSAIIRTRPEMLGKLYEQVAPKIVERFQEREENVKLDLFATFVALLNQTTIVTGAGSPISALQGMVPNIVKGLTKQLKAKTTKAGTRIGAYGVLRQLIQVLPGGLADSVGDLIPTVALSFADKNASSPLKTETLHFLRVLLASHPAKVFHPHIKAITGPVYKGVGDSYYKITAEALRVCCELVKVLRPNFEKSDFDFKPHVKQLYDVTQEKFNANDIDQEVKEEAINCISLIVSRLGDELKAQVPGLLKVLLDRLRNEITRLTAVRAFGEIAASPLKIDLSGVLTDVIKELTSFLRKQNRQLKQQTLHSLTVIIQHYGAEKGAQSQYEELLKELSNLISDAEMHLSHLALRLSATILAQNAGTAASIATVILPPCYVLLTSSLLQGLALESLLALFSAMLNSKAKQLSFETLLDGVVNLVHKRSDKDGELSRSSYSCIAQAIAALSHLAGDEKQNATVARFINDIKKGKGDNVQLLGVYAIGEIGRKVDLSSNKDLKKVILSCFESSSEEVKSAASIALGGITVGNLGTYLPEILAEVDAQPKRQYLLLGSLREVIVSQSKTEKGIENLAKFFDQFSKLLFAHTASEEEGTRNIVAECLGKLALINPASVIAQLKERTKDKSAHTRATVVSALKFAILEKSQPKVDEIWSKEMTHFLSLLRDTAVDVRHATLLAFNYSAHHKPQLVRDLLAEYLPVLYGETKVKPELIIEVELGPFKHKVDNGLPLRQAAFECMYTLLDTCLDRLDLPVFIQNVKDGLGDHYDIRTLNHLMVTKLAQRASASLLSGLDLLIEPLRVTTTTKVKDTAVQHERDRNDELIRSALRAIVAISRIPNVEDNQKFGDFLKGTILQPGLKEKFEQVSKEVADQSK